MPVESLLGSKDTVVDFANFWKRNAQELEMIASVSMVNFCRDNEFTPEQFKAVKIGLNTFNDVFLQCVNEQMKYNKDIVNNTP